MESTRMCFSMMFFVLLFMLLSFFAIVTKNGKQDTSTNSLSVGNPTNTAEIVYIADGEKTSNSNTNINNVNRVSQHSPSFAQNPIISTFDGMGTTGSNGDGIAAAAAATIDKFVYPSGMTRDTSGNVKLATFTDPSSQPTRQPSSEPSMQPSTHPSEEPSTQPSIRPSDQPISHPSMQPSIQPTMQPSSRPSCPSSQPTTLPTTRLSNHTYYVIPNVNCPNNDLGSTTNLNSRQHCNSLCDSTSGCVGTMWSEGTTCSTFCGTCWLKSAFALFSCSADTNFTTTVQMTNSDSSYYMISKFDCWSIDLGSVLLSSDVSTCKAACSANVNCVGFTIMPSTGSCWLKAGLYTSLNCGTVTGTQLYVRKSFLQGGSENLMITTNFAYSGNYQAYAVPPSVKYLLVTAAGSSAEDAYGSTGITQGGIIQALIPVSKINALYLYIGGQNTGGGPNCIGGFNGGGTNGGGGGGGGGGATDVRTIIGNCTSRLLVAGGAGGSSGYGAGGAGGGLIGATGSNGGGGGGGTQSSGGADIATDGSGVSTAGSFCQGGNGWYASGGGGYYGGAGDGSGGTGDTQAGGGGGSSYCIPTGTILSNQQGTNTGAGYLTIQYCITEYVLSGTSCVLITTSPTPQPTMPSSQPSTQPSEQPSSVPSMQPSTHPSEEPSTQPSIRPSDQPISHPSMQPSIQPTMQPQCRPSMQPSTQPSEQPSIQPSMQPSRQPAAQPSMQPSTHPTEKPTSQPSRQVHFLHIILSRFFTLNSQCFILNHSLVLTLTFFLSD